MAIRGKLSKTYCPLPFMHSHASASGRFKPCCNSDVIAGWKYRSTKYNYSEWFVHPEMEQLRNDLLNGVKNKMCDVCWRQEDIGDDSHRTHYIRRFKNTDINNPKITYLDLKLSNECNLACRMCDYTQSNQIYKDMLEMEEKKIPLPMNWERDANFEQVANDDMLNVAPKNILDDIINLLPQLRHLKVTGGEPTITKEFFTLVDYAIEKDYAKNIILSLTTNGTRLTPSFLDKLKAFKKIRINVSFDGIEDNYEYIRYPFTWKMFEKRMTDVQNYMQGENNNIQSLDFTTTAQLINLELLHLAEKWVWNKFGNEADLQIQPTIRPFRSSTDFRFLPKHIIEEANYQCQKINNKTNYYDCEMLHSALEDIIKNYDSEDMMYYKQEQSLKNMVSDIMNLDRIRNQNYKIGLGKETKFWIDDLITKGVYNV